MSGRSLMRASVGLEERQAASSSRFSAIPRLLPELAGERLAVPGSVEQLEESAHPLVEADRLVIEAGHGLVPERELPAGQRAPAWALPGLRRMPGRMCMQADDVRLVARSQRSVSAC